MQLAINNSVRAITAAAAAQAARASVSVYLPLA